MDQARIQVNESKDLRSLMRIDSSHNSSLIYGLKSYPKEISGRFHTDDDGILSYRMYPNEPGFYNFWKTVEKSLKMHDLGHTEKLKIETYDSEERQITPIMLRASRVFSTLKCLDISLSQKVNNFGMTILAHQISNSFPHLEELSLRLYSCPEVDSEGLKAFARIIGLGLSNLRRFNLIDSTMEGKEVDVKNFLLRLSKCALKLTHLQVNLTIQGSTSEELIKQIVSEITKRFPNLQSLNLSYFNMSGVNRVTDEGLVAMTDDITSKLKKLKCLGLSFPSCFYIRDKGMEKVSELIRTNTPNLQSLSLCFQHCDEMTPLGLEHIATRLIPYLKNLKQLSLDFGNVGRLTDESFTNLMNQISTHRQNLTKLDLKFARCWRISGDLWGKTAGKLFTQLKKLKDFSLDFCWNNFSDSTFKKLCIGFEESDVQLNRLKLNFENCRSINYDAVRKFQDIFKAKLKASTS